VFGTGPSLPFPLPTYTPLSAESNRVIPRSSSTLVDSGSFSSQRHCLLKLGHYLLLTEIQDKGIKEGAAVESSNE